MSKRDKTAAQLEGIRKHCLNGVCKMTTEELKARRRKYRDDVRDNPFRRNQYAEYCRKRRKKPGMRERTNAQARARYNADVEKSRAQHREKYRRMMADPERHAAYLKRRRERRHGADGKMTTSAKRSQILEKLIPRWKRVVFDGRDEAYMRRTTPENARLFRMWRDNFSRFDQMIKSTYQAKGGETLSKGARHE